MLEEPMIQTRGFRNTVDGFQLRLRLPYYRGLWANLIEGAAVTIDGESYAADEISWSVAGRTSTLAELTGSPTARWSVTEPAILDVPRKDQLSLGRHEVSVDLRLRMSYIPDELQPTIWSETRTLVICA